MSLESTSPIRSRKASHWAGVLLAFLLGIVAFANGATSCFSGVTETPRQSFFFLIGILAMLSVLPLSVAAITRPNFAARGIAVACLSFNIAFFGSIPWKEFMTWGIPGLRVCRDFLFWTSSDGGRASSARCTARGLARWRSEGGSGA